MAQLIERSGAAAERREEVTLVDCDVHPTFDAHWSQSLHDYLSPEWRQRFGSKPYAGGDAGQRAGLSYVVPFNGFYPIPQSPIQTHLIRDGKAPASDARVTAGDLFDGMGVSRAVLQGPFIGAISAMPTADPVIALAAATNEYINERWLAVDSRYRGTITIASQDPAEAVKEIERWAPDEQWVGISTGIGNVLMGDRQWYPIYEACERHGLSIHLHTLGAGPANYRSGPSYAGGMPSYHMDFRVMFLHVDQANLANMVACGVFVRFPKLKVVVTEVGFAWLPQMMWQMDSFWRGNREDTPWLTRPPSEYILENVRFTTQPFIEPSNGKHIEQILDMISAERLLMFATDYPHWDAEQPASVLPKIPERIRSRVASETAIETFGDRIL